MAPETKFVEMPAYCFAGSALKHGDDCAVDCRLADRLSNMNNRVRSIQPAF
jgi:hypothetical protein